MWVPINFSNPISWIPMPRVKPQDLGFIQTLPGNPNMSCLRTVIVALHAILQRKKQIKNEMPSGLRPLRELVVEPDTKPRPPTPSPLGCPGVG